MTKILVIDDNPTNQRLYSLILTYSGYDVITAGSAKEGIVKLNISDTSIDTILLNHTMRDGNGDVFMEDLPPDYRNISVVVISAGDIDQIIKQYDRLTNKPAGYIQAPIDCELLPVILSKIYLTGEKSAVYRSELFRTTQH